MRIAITRPVSEAMNRCELGYLPRTPIDIQKATLQHAEYELALEALGVEVVSLAPEPDLPDSVFVEDAAVVVKEVAVASRMGAESRRPEAEGVAAALGIYRPVRFLRAPATLDGGDVMQAERTLFVGVSRRTNEEGRRQLAEEVAPFGYSVTAVEIHDCLHMKSGCTYLGRGTILANRAWLNMGPFRDLRVLDVAPEEPWAANVLTIGETAIVHAGFPRTRRILEEAGWKTVAVDISEIQKAEGALTCMSIILD